MKKKVSVIIPVYNMEKYIEKTILSALNQTYSNVEIIVINDGSTDNSEKLIKNFSKEIIYIKQENKGLACARNRGIKESSGEYIALLDADDIWLPERISEEIPVLNKFPEVGLVHSGVFRIDEEGNELKKIVERKKHRSGYISKYIISRKTDIYCPTVLFRKSCIKKVGNFDENLTRLGAEDRDLWYRISREYKIQYINKRLAKYRVRSDSISNNFYKMQKARLYIINKYFPYKKNKFNLKRKKILSYLHLSQGDGFDWRNKNYNKAISEYIKSLKIFPFNFLVYFHLLKVLIKKIIKY